MSRVTTKLIIKNFIQLQTSFHTVYSNRTMSDIENVQQSSSSLSTDEAQRFIVDNESQEVVTIADRNVGSHGKFKFAASVMALTLLVSIGSLATSQENNNLPAPVDNSHRQLDDDEAETAPSSMQSFRLKSRRSGKYLTRDGPCESGTNINVQDRREDEDDTAQIFTRNIDRITSYQCGLILSQSNCVGNVQLAHFSIGSFQHSIQNWFYEDRSDGYTLVKTRTCGVLDVEGGSYENGANVIAHAPWPNNGIYQTDNQEWSIELVE